jgi:hypothetical protein
MNNPMNNDFLNFNTGGAKQETESVGGGRTLFDSAVYPATIKQAYLDKYDSGARFASVTLEINGKDYEERLLLSNGKGESFWTDNDNNPQQYSGLTRLEELVFAAGFANIQSVGLSPANIRTWDKDAKAFVLKQHQTVLTNLHGKQVAVALLKLNQNKQKKNPQTGKYDKLNEAEEINQIDKFSNMQGQTLLEMAKNVNPPQFMTAWKEKWTGKVKDTFKQQKGAPSTGTPTAAGGQAAPNSDNRFG